MRPGFRVGDTLFVLTHTRPHYTDYTEISSDAIESEHFHKKNSTVFITTAYNQEAKRYNNISGGELFIDNALAEFLTKFCPDAANYLIRIHHPNPANEPG
jgi:hypothetical protein